MKIEFYEKKIYKKKQTKKQFLLNNVRKTKFEVNNVIANNNEKNNVCGPWSPST